MKKIAIIGAGISGLFIANLLKRNPNYQIIIYEKESSIPLEEGYGVQLSVNSIKLLNEIGFEKLHNNEKFYPKKINFYSNKNSDKICELDISNFNTEDCRYTTLKRSSLINFLKRDLESLIKTGYNISKIVQHDKQIKLSFENNEINECDHIIISDGIFSKSKSLISNNQAQPKYNDTLAIRGIIPRSFQNYDNQNISLYLGSDFHHVIYPVNPNGDLNFIAIMKYKLSNEEAKNYSLFNDNSFIQNVLEKVPLRDKDFLDDLKELKIFPIFVSNKFKKPEKRNAPPIVVGWHEIQPKNFGVNLQKILHQNENYTPRDHLPGNRLSLISIFHLRFGFFDRPPRNWWCPFHPLGSRRD